MEAWYQQQEMDNLLKENFRIDFTDLLQQNENERQCVLQELSLMQLQLLKQNLINYEQTQTENISENLKSNINSLFEHIEIYEQQAMNEQNGENQENGYNHAGFLEKSKYFDENLPNIRQIDDDGNLEGIGGVITFNWTPAEKFRAKLYQLDFEGRWHDLGTGYFSIEQTADSLYKMALIQEQNDSVNLLANETIETHISFHRQRETIITWSDKEREQDLAVSFQNNQGALYTWHKICQILGMDPDQNSQDSQNYQDDDHFTTVTYDSIPKMAEELRNVSALEAQSKHEIADHFLENDSLNLQKLGDLFEECEKEEQSSLKIDRQTYLQCFFCIYKGLILLNDQRILEVLLSSRFFMQTFGALEWDPEALVCDELSNQDIHGYYNTFENDAEIESTQINEEIEHQIKDSDQNKKEKIEKDEDKEHKEIQRKKQSTENSEKQINKRNRQMSLSDESVGNKENDIYQNSKTSLNYREFLTKIVKFKKVIPLTYDKPKLEQENGEIGPPSPAAQEQERQGQDGENLNEGNSQGNEENQQSDEIIGESATQGTQGGGTQAANGGISAYGIEERIHINYRLSYLKDTVMARYIDDQAVNVINQSIMQNNREIVQFIFDDDASQDPFSETISKHHHMGISLKDQIIEKIKSKTDIKTKHMAIEFMIELCQILKSLQFQQGVGNASNFIYGNSGNGINSRSLYEQLNQVNFIGILAETFAIFSPTNETLDAHLQRQIGKSDDLLIEIYQKENQQLEKSVIEDLIEIKNQNFDVYSYMEEITRLDQMKVNSMEIIIQFQQSVHVPISNINGFVMGMEQNRKGYPFLKQLVDHLQFSPEQGLKIQICDFFKTLFDSEYSQLNSHQNRDILYREILERFVWFLNYFTDLYLKNPDSEFDFQSKYQNLEYSAYLILQILNKVVEQQRYPFNIFINKNQVIQIVAKMSKIMSKIINIEIVKFYKAIMRSKMPTYISMIVAKNMFYPINQIFKATYHPRNPPMIQSVIRDLYEMIFSNYGKTVNEFFSAKLFEYLVSQDQESKEIIFNPLYKDVFGKYDRLNPKEDEEIFLCQNKGSVNGSCIQSIASPASLKGNHPLFEENQIPEKRGEENALFEQKKNHSVIFGDISQMQNDYRRFQQYEQDDDEDDEKEKQEDENTGNLSPIENHSYHDFGGASANEYLKPLPDEIDIFTAALNYQIDKKETDLDKIKQKETFDEFGSPQIAINLEIDHENLAQKQLYLKSQLSDKDLDDVDEIEEHNKKAYQKLISEQKNDEKKKQQVDFEKKIRSSKEESNHWETWKGFGKDSTTGQKASSTASHPNYSQDGGLLFERISGSSSGLLEEGDLAKDMGIFSFNLDQKGTNNIRVNSDIFSPNGAPRYQRTNSFDDGDIDDFPKTTKIGGIFANRQKEGLIGKSGSLGGIFNKIASTQKDPLQLLGQKKQQNLGLYGYNNTVNPKYMEDSQQGVLFQEQMIARRSSRSVQSSDNDHIRNLNPQALGRNQSAEKKHIVAHNLLKKLLDTNNRQSGTSSPGPVDTPKLELIELKNNSKRKLSGDNESPVQICEDALPTIGKRAIDAHTGVIKDPQNNEQPQLSNKEDIIQKKGQNLMKKKKKMKYDYSF